MKNQRECCENIFEDFIFTNITISLPPKKKGVYSIRINKRGLSIDEIENYAINQVSLLRWGMVQDYLLNRIRRIRHISECPVIYIGSAGTSARSKHTLAGRYQDLKKRHTAQYPIWALLYFGWELEYGWMLSDTPAETEMQLKEDYKEKHDGKLPALVSR